MLVKFFQLNRKKKIVTLALIGLAVLGLVLINFDFNVKTVNQPRLIEIQPMKQTFDFKENPSLFSSLGKKNLVLLRARNRLGIKKSPRDYVSSL